MAKPTVPPELLKTIADANGTGKGPLQGAKRKEGDPRAGSGIVQSIRPARTAIAHQRGGNKGK
nr:hypothetical protein [uncultured Holophaga sp.]